MNERLDRLLHDLHRDGVAHDAGKANRLDRLRNLEPDTAVLLALLVRIARARKVLELGTSNGYSTLWLADAVRATGGRLVSVEIDAQRSAQAARNLERGSLVDVVELRVQDAAHTLRDSLEDEWDVIFLDAERPAYVSYWPDLTRALAPGGVLAVDNAISHADQLHEFRSLVSSDPRAFQTVVPTGAGLLVVARDGDEQHGRFLLDFPGV